MSILFLFLFFLSNQNLLINIPKYANKIHKKIEINISNYDLSSSILQMTPKHLEAKKNSEFINREKTKIMKLDTILKNRNLADEKSMLKMCRF